MIDPHDIRECRHRLGWPVARLALHLDVTVRTVRRWEQTAQPVPEGVLNEIGNLLEQAGIDPVEVCTYG